MPDTPLQTPSLAKPDLETRRSTNLMPTSLPRFEGVISCASPTATLPLNLPERRKKFRKARLDIRENVTIQIANTPKLKYEAAELLRGKFEIRGYETAFISNPKEISDTRLLTLLVMKGARTSGTCSLLLDLPNLRLSGDKNHEDCLNDLRQEGKCLIEICRLATRSELTDNTGRVTLAALFSYIALCANYFLDCKPFLITEVNPRHTNYWKNLGFEVLVENSWCDRVNTRSALLGCDSSRLWQLIRIEWQQPVRGSHPSNLLPIAVRRFVRHFMPWEDIEGINRRMTISQHKKI